MRPVNFEDKVFKVFWYYHLQTLCMYSSTKQIKLYDQFIYIHTPSYTSPTPPTYLKLHL